ncbi:UNVERIFIED_ORG: hypothetical protein ABID33_004325 [Xanthobacter viscosus]|jgi:hypothetical protein|uniref:Uncharacterized protein n=1 Tax=Xanthobacter autotrophicus TaxID=280 RepID=A0A6C1KU62_XANAU|nr:hypothetical protein [Xanthobacter autotrophicus]TLX42583.1 hypothetical protein FBQ73_13155 [Xanthobacter autotrophicus]
MLHTIAGLTALALLAAATAVTPARADNARRFDGSWVVRTSAEEGKCNKNFDFKLAVKNGKVTYAGYWPVKAAGGISKLGLVRMTLTHGQRKVTATGLAEGDQASGDWSSPQPKCNGSWLARRA